MAELQEIIRLVEQSLDEPGMDASELARRACLSRFHFDRLASAALGEPPGAFRRRIMLERAAYRFMSTTETVIQIGAEAAYTSPDAFTRAFLRGFGTTPTGYRRGRRSVHDLYAANGIHFHPPGGLRLPATQRSDAMDVLTRMYDHHIELTGAIESQHGDTGRVRPDVDDGDRGFYGGQLPGSTPGGSGKYRQHGLFGVQSLPINATSVGATSASETIRSSR